MLEIKDLNKTYPGFSLDCSLQVPPGRITALVGQNGAGKSTVFKAVLGLITPDGGSVTLFGKDVRSFTPADRQQLGVVLSDSGFSGYLRIGDLVPMLGALYGDFDREGFLARCRRFALPLDKKIMAFSTGMKAKLKVLAAISHGARLLVLDEPTAGLDVVARDELLLLLREFMEADEGRSILISSHISSDLETLCDDLYVIHGGKILLHEDTDRILSHYAILKADPDRYRTLDKKHLLRVRQEPYGWCCLTGEGPYYRENWPGLAAEKGSIDGVISMLIQGEQV